MTNNNVNTATL